MKKIETSALIGLGALGILFGRKMPGVKVIADAERVARYSAQPVVCNGKECHFDYVTPEQGQPVDLVLMAVKATVPEGVDLPADNHKAFLESMAPRLQSRRNAQYAAGCPRQAPHRGGAVCGCRPPSGPKARDAHSRQRFLL